jgi:hypothetical protein
MRRGKPRWRKWAERNGELRRLNARSASNKLSSIFSASLAASSGTTPAERGAAIPDTQVTILDCTPRLTRALRSRGSYLQGPVHRWALDEPRCFPVLVGNHAADGHAAV